MAKDIDLVGTVWSDVPAVDLPVDGGGMARFVDVDEIDEMVVLSYGHSTWDDFIDAYDTNTVVYCRASSNNDPGSGSQNRMAFMAYVNNATTPTEVEFQYYRSVATHSDSQQGDQVYVYKLNKSTGWSVIVREAYSKVTSGTGLDKSYSSGTLTLKLSAASSASLALADSAYQKPGGGIPNSDLASYFADSPAASGNATKTNGILYGTVDNTSTSTAFTATVSGLTSYYDGVCVLLKNGVATSAAGFTININSLGAKPVYTNLAAATAESTKFNVNYTMLFVYDSTRVEGGCWLCYNGYDSNTNTIGYQLRSNSYTLPASDKGYKYRLWFTSADGSKFVPANKSSSTNATAARTPNTTPIDPFGKIVYNSTNGSVDANANLPATTIWEQYTFALGYSFNTTGAALTMSFPAPVYIKCTPTSSGATLDGYVQALPSTADGKIYIFLGVAYSATSIELLPNHPVYEYKDGAVRLYTNAATGGGGTSDYNDLTFDPADFMDGINFGNLPEQAQNDFADIADMSGFMDWLFHWMNPNEW